jgi:hypothetical protein
MGKDVAFLPSQTPQQRCEAREQLFDNTLVSKEHMMCFLSFCNAFSLFSYTFLLSLQCDCNKFPSKN